MAAFVPRSVSKKTPAAAAAGSAAQSAAAKRLAQLNRLKDLGMQRNEARKKNHQEVVEEDRREKLPTNYEAKRARVEWEEEEEKKRKEAEAKGENYDRVKLLEVGADEAERWERKKKRKDPDTGFSDFEQATFRQYRRLTKSMKPDQQTYGREKEKMGETFYPDQNTLGVGEHKDSEDAIDNMVVDLEKQINKRAKYSRRRPHDEDDDINYINERNKAFNQKLERFYGKYTQEIKQNLERGTAV